MKKTFLLILATIATLETQAQTVATIAADATTVSATEAGSYDLIEDMWQMEKGKLYLISLPSELDGYYFGPDAKRMKVKSYSKQNDGTYVVFTEDMADLDDFKVGEAYLVTPDLAIDTIIHITPGIKTELKATEEGKELLLVEQDKIADGYSTIAKYMSISKSITAIYDLLGRKVATMRKGETYIIDGKKIIIK